MDTDSEDLYMVMEYLPMGSLKDYIRTNKAHIRDGDLLKHAMDIAEVKTLISEIFQS